MEKKSKRWIIILGIALVVTIGVVVLILSTTKPMPVALLSEYSMNTLWDEGERMNECAECHNGSDFHTCDSCHDEHGAVELTGITFFEVVELTGDVPDPAFIRVNEVLPDQENAGTHITLYDFLDQNGVGKDDFESVTFTTNDGGLVTIEAQYLDETAMLVPYIDGVRFVTDSVHSSTWLKGINRIVVVGKDKPLSIDGVNTSIGRLLIGETVHLTVEGSDVMLKNDAGQRSHALVANWVEGAPLPALLADPTVTSVTATDANGDIFEVSGEELATSLIAMVRDEVTLVIPDRGRSAWLTGIVKIESN
jgi:hypothetical protein